MTYRLQVLGQIVREFVMVPKTLAALGQTVGAQYRDLLGASAKEYRNKLVRPRWPYDMRPSVRAEKYMCVIVIR